jgi:predicted transcriptional regulator
MAIRQNKNPFFNSVLSILRTISRQKKMNITRIVKISKLSYSYVWEALPWFIKKGYIVELKSNNRRIRLFEITERGKSLLGLMQDQEK